MNQFSTHVKRGLGLFLLMLSIILLTPFKSFAHDAYFLQVLIDDHRYQYVGSVVEDNASWYQSESKHLEKELGKFGGLLENVNPKKDDYEEYEKDLKDDVMIFTFAPKEITGFWGNAKNHATKEDVEKAYLVQETLMASLNDALRVVNNGKPFESIKEMTEMGNKLARAINGSGSIEGFTVTKGKTLDGKPMKGLSKDDYITIVSEDGEKYEFPYRVKKGYSKKDDYSGDTEYLTWHQIMYQANYAYAVHGYTLRTASEMVKPSALEEMVVGMFENLFNQLRNLLGLYDINELVFNDGIRGSSAFTHGIMAKGWSDTATAYHWLFQALAWSLITFAIVKNLLQRNIATINPVMRVSLIESIQNLLVTGFILANAIPLINMLMFLNAKLVSVFGATAPNFSDLAGMNAYTNTLGGIIMQFAYLGIAIYLNFVYIMRAISIAILIATAPLFIVTIAFGGKWKQLFGTWMRELVGGIFLQTFHAFMLSFFFAISTSSRGIEGLIVLVALIPMTEFFRGLVMGQGGKVAHAMGMNTMTQASTMVGGALANKRSQKNNNNPNNGQKSSGRESSSTTMNDSGMNSFVGNSEKIKNNSQSMNQRQRMNATKQTQANREMPLHVAENKNHPDRANFMNTDLQTEPKGFVQKSMNAIQGVGENLSNAKEAFDDSKAVKGISAVGQGAKALMGAGQATIGASVALATGDDSHLQLARRGVHNMKSGSNNMVSSMKSLPDSTKAYSTTLPNGDLQVHRKAGAMAQQGIVGATMEGSGKTAVAKYTYDMKKFSPQDKKNLTSAYDAFKQNDTNAISHYRSQGIENMTKNGNGDLVVRYNQTGMEKMGIKSVQTIGASGKNARIVETKPAYAPNTPVTLSVPNYTPPQTPPQNGEKEKNQN